MKGRKTYIVNLAIMYGGLFLGFFVSFFKAKVFTPEEIGVLSTIFSGSLIVNTLIVSGSNSAILKYYVTILEDKRKKSAFLLFIGVLPAVLMVLVAILFIILKDIILEYYKEPLLYNYYNYIFVFLVFNFLTTNLDMLFRAEKISAIGNFVNNFLSKVLTALSLISIFFFLNSDFKYFMLVSALMPAIQALLLIGIYKKKIPLGRPDKSFITKEFRKTYYKFSAFMLLSQASSRITEWIDKIFIGAYMNFSWVGIYTVVLSFINLVKVISRAINMSIGPEISKAWHDGDIKKLRERYSEVSIVPLFLGLTILIFFIIFGKNLLEIFDKEYTYGYYALIILTVGELVNIGTSIGGTILKYSDKFKYDLYIQGILFALTIVTNMIFIPIWGINGAAIATALTVSIYNIFKLIIVYKLFKLQPFTLETVKVLINFGVTLTLLIAVKGIFKNYNLLQLFTIAMGIGIFQIATGAWLFRIDSVKKLVGVFINKALNKGKN